MKKFATTTIAVFALAAGGAAIAQKNPMVGGAAMYPTKTIVENASASKDHKTLVAAAGRGPRRDAVGPGSVHRLRTDRQGVRKLPKGTVETLVKPENKAQLTSILTYHVVPRHDHVAGHRGQGEADGGTATYTTVNAHAVVQEGGQRLCDHRWQGRYRQDHDRQRASVEAA